MTIQTNEHGSSVTLPDGNNVTQIGTTMSKWVEGFSGAAYAAGAASLSALSDPPGQWDIVRTPTNMTVTLANGSLAVNMGTTNGDQLMMLGRTVVTAPQNLIVTATFSARQTGNETRFGLLECDPVTLLPVDHATLTGFFRNSTSILLNSNSSTGAVAEAMEDNLGAMKTSAITIGGSASISDYSIELRPEDVTITSQSADSTNIRNGTGARLSSVVPNPNRVYRPFLWFRNVSVPGGSTTVTVSRVVSMDIQELQAEVGGGRGNFSPSQAIPVVLAAAGATAPVSIAATLPVSIAATVSTSVVSTVAAATTNGASNHKLIAAATTNATVVKSSGGRIVGGQLTNVSASWRFFKLYNKTTAPTVGTDTPFVCIPIPPNGQVDVCAMVDQYGIYAATGLSYAITGAAADNDTTAIASGDVIVFLVYA